MSRIWHIHTETDGCEGPYGLESVSKLFTGIVCLHAVICVTAWGNLHDLMCHMYTYGLCR